MEKNIPVVFQDDHFELILILLNLITGEEILKALVKNHFGEQPLYLQ